MNNYFDETIRQQVEQFNQQVETASNFHRERLKELCAERIREDFDKGQKPPMRIRVIPPKRPADIFGSMLQQVGRVGNVSKRIARRILPARRKLVQVGTDQPDVIEGEYVVLTNESNKSNHNT